jgi:hypothetical protein
MQPTAAAVGCNSRKQDAAPEGCYTHLIHGFGFAFEPRRDILS